MKNRSHQNIEAAPSRAKSKSKLVVDELPKQSNANKENIKSNIKENIKPGNSHKTNNINKQNGSVEKSNPTSQAQKRSMSVHKKEKQKDDNGGRGKSSGRIWKDDDMKKQVLTEQKNSEQQKKPSKTNPKLPPLPNSASEKSSISSLTIPLPALTLSEMGETKKNEIRNMKITIENSDKVKEDGTIPIKLVLVGDGSVGKTSMLISYTTDNFPTEYVPTVFDNYTADIKYGKHRVKLWLWDTAGQEQYAQLRLISYQKADIFLICFSLIDQNSFNNAINKWLPEVHEECPKAIKILVGTKLDLHSEYMIDPKNIHKAIRIETIQKKCESKRVMFMKCSGLDQKGLSDVFNRAMGMIIERVQKRKKEEPSLCQLI